MLLSVIIPTRNRARRLADLLDSLANQRPVPFEWEVIVVDNASTDDTAQIAHHRIKNLPIMIRYVFEPQMGLHHGRHRGARESKGISLGYLDDDMILAPTWIQGVELLVLGRADAVVGRILPKWEIEPPQWLEAFWNQDEYGKFLSYLGLADFGETPKPIKPLYVFGGNCFMRRETLYDLGGFHPDGMPDQLLRFRGDGETALMRNFELKGMRSYYDPRAIAYHIIDMNRLTVEYFCRRAYNQGISDSFTQIRAIHALAESPILSYAYKSFYERLKGRSAREIAGASFRMIKRMMGLSRKDPLAEIRSKIDEAYQAGWKFHQDEVKNDPALLEYALKETYWE